MISPILDVPSAFLQFWHLSTLCLTLFLTLALTYGASIGGASEVSIFLITLANLLDYPACAIYLCSLIIEILTACPVSGFNNFTTNYKFIAWLSTYQRIQIDDAVNLRRSTVQILGWSAGEEVGIFFLRGHNIGFSANRIQ